MLLIQQMDFEFFSVPAPRFALLQVAQTTGKQEVVQIQYMVSQPRQEHTESKESLI